MTSTDQNGAPVPAAPTTNLFVRDAGLPTDERKMQTAQQAALGPRKPVAILLNPPGTQKYFRDYFCSLVSKSAYYYHPVDLVYLSGILDRGGYFVECIDAIANSIDPAACTEMVQKIQPDLLIYLTSSPSYEEDTTFLTSLRQAVPNTTFVGVGDIYRELRESVFDVHPFCDAVLTDFSTPDLMNWLKRSEDVQFNNIIYRAKDGRMLAGPEIHGHGFYDMAVPRWDLWPLSKYAFPFAESPHWATIITDFGCPFSCTFCPMSTTGYKLRGLDSVRDELRLLKSLGVNELFVRDQTFGVNRTRTKALLAMFKEHFPDLRWTCWSRVDLVTEDLLREIAAAGCHTVMFGIETSNEDILKQYKKNTSQKQMFNALEMTKRFGMKTVGTFVIGLPGEDAASIERTIEFATKLPLDYASFNIATPRFGSSFRKLLKADGKLDVTRMGLDSSGSRPAWMDDALKEETGMSSDVIFALHRKAVRTFYLRPLHLLKQLLAIRTPYQLYRHIREAFDLIH